MKTNMKKIIAPVGLTAFALVCVFGGMALTAHMDAVENEKIQAELAQREAQESQNNVPEVVYSFAPIETPASQVKDPTATPKPSYVPASETVEVADDGTVTITPDFAHQRDGATKIQTPEVQVSANMGGSGGSQLELGSDGAYHGDNVATPAPVASQPPVQAEATPAPADPAPVPTPAPAPSEGQQSPPNYTGKNGEVNGNYAWLDGFGWVERGGSNGASFGGQIDDSAHGWGWGEMGETVGNM